MIEFINGIFKAIVLFFVALLLNATTEYFTQDKGEVIIGTSMSIQGQLYLPIDLSNFTTELFDGILFSIPSNVSPTAILASNPTQIKEIFNAIGTKTKKQIVISGVAPNQLTKILIPINSPQEAELIQFINGKDLKWANKRTENISNRLAVSIKSVLIQSVLQALFLFISLFVIEQRVHKFANELNDFKEELGKKEKENNEISDKLKEIELYARKSNIILLARLSDYSRELDFWRDTIRKILYKANTGKHDIEILINQITESLKTYGTKNNDAGNFKTINVLAGILNAEKQGHQ